MLEIADWVFGLKSTYNKVSLEEKFQISWRSKKHLSSAKLLLSLHLSEISLKQHTEMPDAVLRKEQEQLYSLI